jgi:hypothetical protein
MVALVPASAWAGTPTIEDAKAAVRQLEATLQETKLPDLRAAEAVVAPPFW